METGGEGVTFTKFKPITAGRVGLKNCLTISSTQIYFGKQDTTYEYYVIEYDTDNKAIRFSEGSISNGYKILKTKSGAKYINATNFIKKGLLPSGRYELVGELTYKQK